MAADQQRRTGTFELGALPAGFSKQPMSLLAIGGVMILAGIVFLAVLLIFIGAEVFGATMHGPDPSLFLGARFWLAILVGMALMVPVDFATYLAPQLIVPHDQPAHGVPGYLRRGEPITGLARRRNPAGGEVHAIKAAR